jgi:cysteine dioxygenase
MKTLQDLIEMIRLEFGNKKSIAECDVQKLQDLMESYQSNPTDWTQYAHFDPNKYTRNLVDDGNGQYNLIVLCWGPGQRSPIHDHSKSHCIFKVLNGELNESRYDWPDRECEMKLRTEDIYVLNQVNYMHDKIGLHRVSNQTQKPAISLHLYSPPILECQTFVEETGVARASGKCCFYSKYGTLCNVANQLCDKLQAIQSSPLQNIKEVMNTRNLPPLPSKDLNYKLSVIPKDVSDITVIDSKANSAIELTSSIKTVVTQ